MVLLAHGDKSILVVTDSFHEARCLAIASSVGLTASATPTQTSPIKGWSTVPYYAKETVGVGLGRIIGFNHLTSLHFVARLTPARAEKRSLSWDHSR